MIFFQPPTPKMRYSTKQSVISHAFFTLLHTQWATWQENLISLNVNNAFLIHSLESIIANMPSKKISRLQLVSVAEPDPVTNPEDRFSNNDAQILQCLLVCLFDLILYVPSTIFQLNKEGSFWVEPVLS